MCVQTWQPLSSNWERPLPSDGSDVLQAGLNNYENCVPGPGFTLQVFASQLACSVD